MKWSIRSAVTAICAVLAISVAAVSGVPEPSAAVSGAHTVADARTLSEILSARDYVEAEHGEILRLYRAIFNREPDVVGAKYWIHDVYGTLGNSVDEIADFIATDSQPEFRAAYANVTTNAAFVNRLYENMLGRAPDPAGLNYWVALLDSGFSRSQTARWVATSKEFVARYPYKAIDPDPVPVPVPEPVPPFTFTAGGDHGANSKTALNLQAIAALKPRFHLAVGDLSYSDTETEAEWCDYVRAHLGDIPVQLVVGNHEDDENVDGHIGEFSQCLGDQMNSKGVYAAEYYFDVDGLARVIMIGADTSVDGERYTYEVGSGHYLWLESVIDDARAEGIKWIVVGMHKVCISAGAKSCEIGPDVVNLLAEKRVDLILHGHEHNYQRSKQVTCVTVDSFTSSCVVDDGSDGAYEKGAGTVWVVSGVMGGGSLYAVDTRDPEYEYLAAEMGTHHSEAGRGFVKVTISPESLVLDFVSTSSEFSDHFTISGS